MDMKRRPAPLPIVRFAQHPALLMRSRKRSPILDTIHAGLSASGRDIAGKIMGMPRMIPMFSMIPMFMGKPPTGMAVIMVVDRTIGMRMKVGMDL